MNNTVIKKGAKVEKSIIAERVEVGENTELGVFEEAENKYKPVSYTHLKDLRHEQNRR